MHLSDIHVWRYCFRPWRLASKRLVGMTHLLAGRARRFRRERLGEVVERVRGLRPDHVLITGDLTTTALPAEFEDARRDLAPLLGDVSRATVLPGNHDRYTGRAVRSRAFEGVFGEFAPRRGYPWLRTLDDQTAILGLDPTRAHYSARGVLRPAQLTEAQALLAERRPRRLIVACHYPLAAPEQYRGELATKRLENAEEVRDWLAGVGPHLFCCGHVHAAWAFSPPGLPGQLCLNAGAPLLHDRTGRRRPGFLEIELDGDDVRVAHHGWDGSTWSVVPLGERAGFFAAISSA